MRADLGQQFFSDVRRRFPEEYGPKFQSAADRFFHDPHAFNGAFAALGPLPSRECLPQFLHRRMVAAFDFA